MNDIDVPHEMILEFLEENDEEIRDRYNSYREENLKSDQITSGTTLDKRQTNPVLPLLALTEIAIRQTQERNIGQIPFEAYKALELCWFMTEYEDLEVLDVAGQNTNEDVISYFSREITSDYESFWDYFYELEITHLLNNSGINAKPVDESQSRGPAPDLIYDSGESDLWIECKNKRNSTDDEWELERLGREIMDRLWSRFSLSEKLGEDSFGIRIRTDDNLLDSSITEKATRENFLKTVTEDLYDLIKWQYHSAQIEFEGIHLDIKLTGYHSGRYKVRLTDQEMSVIENRGDLTKFLNPYEHVNFVPDPFEENGHGVFSVERCGDNAIEIFQAYALGLDVPWDIAYHSWIFSTVSQVKDQFPSKEEIIVFVNIPVGIVVKMKEDEVTNHEGESVTKWERLKERIVGMYSDESSRNRIKAVILTTDVIEDNRTNEGIEKQMRKYYEMIPNKNVEDAIPSVFFEFIERKKSIEMISNESGRLMFDNQFLPETTR